MSGRLQILGRAYTPPQPGDARYVRLTEQTLGAQVFNDQMRVVRRVVVSGVALVLDAGDSTGLLETTRGADDVAEVYIAADSVAINTALTFPGAHVYLYARSVTFGDENSFIDTTPPPRTARDPRVIDGRDGLGAGDITVIVNEYHPASPTAQHFRAKGGPGEPGDDGGLIGTGSRKDVPPLTAQEWEGLMSPSHRHLEHEEVFWSEGYAVNMPYMSFDQIQAAVPGMHDASGRPLDYTLTYAEINNSYYTNNIHTATSTPNVVASIGSKDMPGTGANAATPGRPGTGGKGGTFTGVPAAAAGFQGNGGPSGPQHVPSPGGQGGSPAHPIWVFFEGRPDGSNHNIGTRWQPGQPAVAGQSSAPGPLAMHPAGPVGGVVPVQGVAAQAWVNAVSIGTVLAYAHDTLAAADWPTALKALQPYLDVCAPAPKDGPPSLGTDTLAGLAQATPAALGDLEALTAAARDAVAISAAAQGSLDEYGNPVGWAPSVSLDTAVDVYHSILDGVMNQLDLSYKLQYAWSKLSQRDQNLDSMIASLTAASDQARKDLVQARSALVSVNPTTNTSPFQELDALLQQSKGKANQLTDRLNQLKNQADQQQFSDDQKHAIAAGLQIAGALVKAIPLPEPYQTIAGGVGTLSQITSAFVEQGGNDQAFDALQSKVKEFTDREDLADSFTTDLDAAMGTNDKRSADLTKQADSVADQLAKLQDARQKADDAEKARDQAAQAAAEAAAKALETARATGTTDDSNQKATAVNLDKAEADLTAQQKAIAGQQKELEQANAGLAGIKKERVATVKTAAAKVQQVATGVAEVGKAINSLMVYQSELDSRWAATLAGIAQKDDQLASIKRDIDYLNDRKRAVASVIEKYEQQMTTAAETISRNAVALVELRAQHARSRDALDPQALGYIQAAQRDAQRTLAQFLYYVVKAYEYYTVKPWKDSQYTMINQIFDKLGVLLASSKDVDATTINPDDLNTLKGVYEAPLTDMAREMAQNLMTGATGRQDVTTDDLTLAVPVLAELNKSLADGYTSAAVVNPAALGWLDTGKERQRIRGITVKSVSARKVPDSQLPERVVFTFVHTGQSTVRAGGRLFAFVASDNRPDSPLQPSVTWETRASGSNLWTQDSGSDVYQLASGSLAATVPGDEGNLLSKLMQGSSSAPELAKLSRFRPGGFSDLGLLVEVTPASARLELTGMVVTVEQEAVTDISHAMVTVLSNVDAAIPVTLSRPDLSGTNFGTCDLYAIFDRNDLSANPVKLTAPPKVADLTFTRWVIDGTPAAAAEDGSSVVVKQSCQAVAEYAAS